MFFIVNVRLIWLWRLLAFVVLLALAILAVAYLLAGFGHVVAWLR